MCDNRIFFLNIGNMTDRYIRRSRDRVKEKQIETINNDIGTINSDISTITSNVAGIDTKVTNLNTGLYNTSGALLAKIQLLEQTVLSISGNLSSRIG